MKKNKINKEKMKLFIDMYLKTSEIDDLFEWINKEHKKEEKEEYKVNVTDESIAIYDMYPSKCPIRGARLKTGGKTKDKIVKLIDKHGYQAIKTSVQSYIKESIESKVYFKSFSTLLNNLNIEDYITEDLKSKNDTVSYLLNGEINQCLRKEVPQGGIVLKNR